MFLFSNPLQRGGSQIYNPIGGGFNPKCNYSLYSDGSEIDFVGDPPVPATGPTKIRTSQVVLSTTPKNYYQKDWEFSVELDTIAGNVNNGNPHYATSSTTPGLRNISYIGGTEDPTSRIGVNLTDDNGHFFFATNWPVELFGLHEIKITYTHATTTCRLFVDDILLTQKLDVDIQVGLTLDNYVYGARDTSGTLQVKADFYEGYDSELGTIDFDTRLKPEGDPTTSFIIDTGGNAWLVNDIETIFPYIVQPVERIVSMTDSTGTVAGSGLPYFQRTAAFYNDTYKLGFIWTSLAQGGFQHFDVAKTGSTIWQSSASLGARAPNTAKNSTAALATYLATIGLFNPGGGSFNVFNQLTVDECMDVAREAHAEFKAAGKKFIIGTGWPAISTDTDNVIKSNQYRTEVLAFATEEGLDVLDFYPDLAIGHMTMCTRTRTGLC
jgi:hypothetical protein